MKKLRLFSALAFSVLVWSCSDHTVPSAGTYQLDDKKSVAEWKGSQRTGYFNEGAITVKSENLMAQNGRVTGGSFTIPLSSIVNFNLPTDELKQMLVHHLQSADFFNMAVHPNLTYTITSVTPYAGTEGVAGANYQVNGSLTMLGQTHSVNFPAKIDLSNTLINVEATLQVDRTRWGIIYASDPALSDDNFINPNIGIHLKLTGSKQ